MPQILGGWLAMSQKLTNRKDDQSEGSKPKQKK